MRSRLVLISLLAIAGLSVGVSASHAKPSKPKTAPTAGTTWYKGALVSIFTEKDGAIINIAVDVDGVNFRDIRTISGCGLDIDDLPHLASGFGSEKVVQVQSVDGCIGRINVMMKN